MKPVIAILLGTLFCIIVGIIITIITSDNENYHTLGAFNNSNQVEFNDGVKIIENTQNMQDEYENIKKMGNCYIMQFDEMPKSFRTIKDGDVFCAYPDTNASESFFNMGFVGKLKHKTDNNKKCEIQFSIPSIKEVFKKVKINTSNNQVTYSKFIPSENVEIDYSNIKKASINTPTILAERISDKITIGTNTASFTYNSTDKISLLKDYTLLCESLKLKLKNKSTEGPCDFSISGSVELKQPAVKMVLDYSYNKNKDKIVINDYALGLCTKQKINASIEAEKEVGLDDLIGGSSSPLHIIDLEDVTDTEKGKIVLGTYLVGMEANLPILRNKRNNVSYLSLGVAIQVTMTAKGKLGLEYDIEESGFFQCEARKGQKTTYKVKGYEYPNPVVDATIPDEELEESQPDYNTSVKGKVNIDVAFGVDAGVCVLGMIPIKMANNLAEVEITKEFESEEQKNELVSSSACQKLLDNNVDYLKISLNSKLKMHFGAKLKLGFIKYNIGKVGGEAQLMNMVYYQYPNPKGFVKEECDFGGVLIGEIYNDEQLNDSFKKYEKTVGLDAPLNRIDNYSKTKIVNSVISKIGPRVVESLDNDSKDIVDNYKYDYRSGDVIYVRDENDRVIYEIITDENVINRSGFGTGLTKNKTDQIYSSPNNAYSFNIELGLLTKLFLDMTDLQDIDISCSEYDSRNSDDKMILFYGGDELKLIMIKH